MTASPESPFGLRHIQSIPSGNGRVPLVSMATSNLAYAAHRQALNQAERWLATGTDDIGFPELNFLMSLLATAMQ